MHQHSTQHSCIPFNGLLYNYFVIQQLQHNHWSLFHSLLHQNRLIFITKLNITRNTNVHAGIPHNAHGTNFTVSFRYAAIVVIRSFLEHSILREAMPLAGPAATALLRSMAGITLSKQVTIIKQHETHGTAFRTTCSVLGRK